MIAIWIMAGSQLLMAVGVAAYAALRISDEIRFRRALDGVEKGAESGTIVIPRKQYGKKREAVRSAAYGRRKRAQEWIDEMIKEAEMK